MTVFAQGNHRSKPVFRQAEPTVRQQSLRLLHDFAESVPAFPLARVFAAVSLFDFLDLLRIRRFPQDWFAQLERHIDLLNQMHCGLGGAFDLTRNSLSNRESDDSRREFAERTGHVYAQLWSGFAPEEYFDETLARLRERFSKNQVSVTGVRHALDDGCGGGRYTLALKALGACRVTGIDISDEAIALATSKNPFPDNSVEFRQASVLDIPFENESFDFVFSNGVLHHTASTEQGLAEIHRVLEPGGKAWLYLYGGKESLFWDIVDSCRALLAGVPQSYTQDVMRVMGYPPGRIFCRCDFFYVPVHRRYFEREVAAMLRTAGFSAWRRLRRGTATDWDEILFVNPRMDPYIYGEGEMRFLIEK